jgi:hypothetical protein
MIYITLKQFSSEISKKLRTNQEKSGEDFNPLLTKEGEWGGY